jgi:DNA-binding MarR family transcriptional regulator
MGDTSPRRRGRRPTPTELEVWRLFIETSLDVKARMDRAMLVDSGLSSSDHVVLLALSRAEGRWLRTSELAATIFWERSRLSHQVRRMAERGLVRRERSSADQRGSEVHLTPKGLDALRDASGPHLRHVRELFVDALDDEQQAAVASAMHSLGEHLARLDAEDDAPTG